MRAWISFASLFVLSIPSAGQSPTDGPAALVLTAPIETWDEGLPLGDGHLGALVWGADQTLNLSLDRGDLWDERLPEEYSKPDWTWATIRELVARGDQAEISRRFDVPYEAFPYPTKLPGGRLVLYLDASGEARRFELDLARALATVDLGLGRMQAFVSAVEPVTMVRVDGPDVEPEFLRPAGLDRLGYAPAGFGSDGGTRWMVQEAALGLSYAVVVASERVGDSTRLAVTIASSHEGDDPLAIGRERVERALRAGWDAMLAPHEAWWRDFWAVSDVDLPDERIQHHYHLVKYLYGAGSRRGAPPTPLQGVWTRDDGGLPPWKGDYHHDLNTQTTYLAYGPAGLFDCGLSFLDQQWELLPVYREFARAFYGLEQGALVPGVATQGGQPTAGWSQYALSPTNGLWIGQLFDRHWRLTGDREFLAERAYPWLSEVAEGVLGLMEETDGHLRLPLSSSPEIHDNSLAAWLEPDSNYDQALVQWAFGALREMADVLGRGQDVQRWDAALQRLEALLVDEQGVLMFARGEPLDASHRHHSHALAIHPLGLLRADRDERSRAIVDATLDRMAALGTQAWVGYSFSWFACMLARADRGDEALRYLADYERAFTLRNGFHVNGDQLGVGLSGFRYRPFTLEGNFLAMEAVHELLLRSRGRSLQVFPAVPGAWKDVSFGGLRAEHGYVVDAERRNGVTTRVRVTATVPGTLRLRDPFPTGAAVQASRPTAQGEDPTEILCDLEPGATLELTLVEAPSPPTPDRVGLEGSWRFQLDPDGVGEAERWFTRDLDDSIELPGTTDLAGKGHPLDPDTMTYPVPFEHLRFPGLPPAERADERGFLVRELYWIGPAWYQRTIEVPESWAGRPLRLTLERVLWSSDVWVDDRHVGRLDSLAAPHAHDLGVLEPGTHRLTLRVDNSEIHPIGTIGHAYGPETQSRWNGVVGRIELAAERPCRIRRIEVHPAADRRSVRVLVHVQNDTPRPGTALFQLEVGEEGAPAFGRVEERADLEPGPGVVELTVPIEREVRGWDEFDPTLHVLSASLDFEGRISEARTTFGFRHIERDGRTVRVNGRPVLLRGTLDCAVYPRTGHPPTTVDEWLDVLGTIQGYGFNHVRFHTWCPPEAAFEAADRLGIYLAPETAFWVDNWTADLPGGPRPLGEVDEVTQFVRDELRRMSEAYGNHPSFALVCIGNEFGSSSDWALVDRLLAEAKERDPRRLYNAATARQTVASDDYWVTHTVGPVRARGVGPARTDWDFADAVAATELPLVAHETGQRPTFPDYEAILPAFDGPLQPWNLVRFRDRFAASGLAGQAQDLVEASARFQMVQYKAEHEAFRRTAGMAGYQLLMLNDFTGQSEALVGVLDPFWRPKGIVTADEVRRWNAPTVALARFPRFTWTTDEVFTADLEASHFGARDVPGVTARWSLMTRDGRVRGAGELGPVPMPAGGITRFGPIDVPLGRGGEPEALVLRVAVGEAVNEWPLWAYPPAGSAQEPDEVLVASRLDDGVLAALAEGRRVVLLVHGMEGPRVARTRFESVYWSAAWWGDPFSSLGILCDPSHPALAGFPTGESGDWQWHELEQGASTVRLDGVLDGAGPIVQAVPDFHYNTLLARVFEARIGTGRLLVCGYDLERDLESRHAARALRASLLAYAASEAFEPRAALSPDGLHALLAEPEPVRVVDPVSLDLSQATLHVRAVPRLEPLATNVPWSADNDEVVRRDEGFGWQVTSGGTWRDEVGSAWHGDPLRILVGVPKGAKGTLYLRVSDWNALGRRGRVVVEGVEHTLGDHVGPGVWVAFEVADSLPEDGQVSLELRPTVGPNLMVRELAFVP